MDDPCPKCSTLCTPGYPTCEFLRRRSTPDTNRTETVLL